MNELIPSEPWFLAGWSNHISPSALGRAAACPRSEAMPHVRDNTPAARKGTVAHKFLADVLEHGRDLALGMVEDPSDIEWLSCLDLERLPAFEREAYEPEVSLAYNPITREARILGTNLTREEARAKARDEEIVGTIDVLGQTEYAAVAHDYKTGWGYVEPAEVNWQLRTYALFAARWMKKERAIYSVIRVKDNGNVWTDIAEMDELELMAHEEALIELLQTRGRVRRITREGKFDLLPPLSEGKHCRYCPAFSVCPAKVFAVRALGTPSDKLATTLEGPLTPEEAATAWKRVRFAQKTLERYEAVLRDYARQTPIPLSEDGEVLGEKSTPKETIVPERARTALERQYGAIGAAVAGEATETKTSMTKSAFRSALKRLILPTLPEADRKISWLERDAMKLLREAGAVTTVVTKTVCEHTPKAETKSLPDGEAAA